VRQLRWHEKLRRRKSEGGAGIHFPHTPFSSRPARAEFLKINFRIFVKKGSDFVQKVPPVRIFQMDNSLAARSAARESQRGGFAAGGRGRQAAAAASPHSLTTCPVVNAKRSTTGVSSFSLAANSFNY